MDYIVKMKDSKRKSQTIQFDMQRNTFYRIDKETGEATQTYKNGDKLPAFKPNITGIDYKDRQVSKSKNQELGNSKSKHYNYRNRKLSLRSSGSKQKGGEQKYNIHNKYNTINFYEPHNSNNRNFLSIGSPKSRTSFDLRPEITVNNFNTFKMTASIFSEENKSKQSPFVNLSRQYNLIKDQHAKINHSPKQSVQGSVEKKSRLEILCLTKTNFRNQDEPELGYQSRNPKGLSQIPRKLTLSEKYSEKQQVQRDKKLFYELYPNRGFREQSKSIQKQKDRRKNLLKLQKLTIATNNKLTRQIISKQQE